MSPNMSKALGIVIANLEKNYGKGVVMTLTEDATVDPDNVVSSGSIALDTALGIGGYRKGRIVEIYGPEASGKTTLCLHAVANAQKQGKVCAYIDAEHALDPLYMSNIGVNLDKLLVSQPDYGEQALEITDSMARSGEVNLIVIDSVAALVPRKELEGEMGDSHVGLQARLMSQAMRKLSGTLSRAECIIMFVNQIRYKIGVKFGCFHYDARILLADGTTEKIGKIVNQKMDVEVLSRSPEGKFASKRIVDWHDNGKAEKFYNLVIDYPHGSGRSHLPIGDDHKIFTPQGEKLASELNVGDNVLVKSTTYLTKEQQELALGTFLGDGSLRANDAENTASLRLGHGQAQYTYLQYKTRFLGPEYMSNDFYPTGTNGFGCDSRSSSELVWLSKYKNNGAIRFIDDELANRLTLRAIAIWYLDDGTFGGSYKYWGWGKSEIAATKLDQTSKMIFADRCEELGLPTPAFTKHGFMFSGKDNCLFQKAIAKYVPECMSYKIHPKLRYCCDQRFSHSGTTGVNQKQEVLISAKIVDIYDKPISRATHKFDITVDDNHCYFVDNVLVHNSPETTTGGNALKFYASQRLDIRRIGAIKDGDKIIGNRTRVKVVKNKLAPPFREAEFDIRFGVGIDKTSEIIEIGAQDGVVKKSGAWYSYNSTRVGQGKNNSVEFLEENDDIREEITTKILELRGLESVQNTKPDSKSDKEKKDDEQGSADSEQVSEL